LTLSLAAAVAATEAAVLLLRPRSAAPRPAPVAARDYFSPAEIDRARRFRRGQRALGLASAALDTAILTALVRRPPQAHPAAVAAGLTVGMTVAGLPLSAVARARGVRVGLVTQSWGGWAVDLVKAQAVTAPVAAGAGALLDLGKRRFGERWWLPGAGGLLGFGVLSLLVGPALLDPLFNRFEPAPADLRARVEALAESAGVPVDRVIVMDASKRTTASNAYVTGLGPTKRVVLFDTLLRDFSEAEVDFVVAHELAHVRHRDVQRALVMLAVTGPATVRAIAAVAEELGDSLPATALAAGLVAIPVGMVSNRLSRAVERRADRFAIDLVGDPRTQIAFQRGICVRNVAEPEPPRWVQALSGTHPTTLERIAMAEAAASAS
jgi:STE24 endopeptidase